jgi:hypothetical protein
VVEAAQVQIVQVLGDQVADGQAPARQRMIGVKEGLKQFEQRPVLEPAPKRRHHNTVIDGIKIFPDIQLEIPGVPAGAVPGPCNVLSTPFFNEFLAFF